MQLWFFCYCFSLFHCSSRTSLPCRPPRRLARETSLMPGQKRWNNESHLLPSHSLPFQIRIHECWYMYMYILTASILKAGYLVSYSILVYTVHEGMVYWVWIFFMTSLTRVLYTCIFVLVYNIHLYMKHQKPEWDDQSTMEVSHLKLGYTLGGITTDLLNFPLVLGHFTMYMYVYFQFNVHICTYMYL